MKAAVYLGCGPCRTGLVLGHRRDHFSTFEIGDEDELAVKTFPIRLHPSDARVAPRCLRIHRHAAINAFNDRLIPDAAVC